MSVVAAIEVDRKVALPSRIGSIQCFGNWMQVEEVEVETGVIVAETPQSAPGTLSTTVPGCLPCGPVFTVVHCGARAGRRDWLLGGGRGKGKTRLAR